MEIPILWKDPDLLVVNKPPGLLSIQDGYHSDLPHLYGLLRAAHGPLWIVHRLDKDTSGIILFARSAEAHRSLNQQFEHRQTHKEYHALSCGSPDWDEQEINLPLRTNGDRKHRTVVDRQNGKPAQTDVFIMQRYPADHPGYALIKALPLSGYTHQVRAHLAAVGLPLVGDPLYKSLIPTNPAVSLPNPPIQRTALHAFQISFLHPGSGKPLVLQAPYPHDFQDALKFLEALGE